MGELETPWQRGRKKSRSKEQEERTSRMRGARPQVNSGRIWSSLRDNTLTTFVGSFLIDNKTTERANESFRIERKKWLELRRDANRTPPGCLPGLQVDLQDVHLLVVEVAAWEAVERYVIALEDKLERAQDEIRLSRQDDHVRSVQVDD